MKALFEKNHRERSRLIRESSGRDKTLLVYPKKMNRSGIASMCVSYEDVSKDDVWLKINSIVNSDWRLILECPSRYPKITSKKVQYLQKLSMKLKDVVIVDSVPFTLGIEYLYTPFSYLGREVLGYPHWYAFRENYDELIDGQVVKSLSPEALGPKLRGVSGFGYSRFSGGIELVDIVSAQGEVDGYEELKHKAFSEHSTPAPVITKLADYSHACSSRIDAVLSVAMPGDAVFCNLKGYAKKLQGRLPKGCVAYSYAKPPGHVDGRVIIAEPSIANDYQQFDAESLSDDIILIKSDLGVDKYLHGKQDSVRKQIDALAEVVTNG